MSCYLRHLSGLFEEQGLEYNKANRQKVDRRIRTMLDMPEERCPEVWKRIKPMLSDQDGRHSLEQIIREVSTTQ